MNLELMKVREAMTSDVGFCQPDTNLAAAAILMWQRDCGVVPVVDEQQKVVGMITDRDVCMAAATKNRPISEIPVSEVIWGSVRSCAPGDDLEDALKKMKKSQVRRLPVVNRDGALVGIISLSDLLRHAKEVSRKKLVSALQEISHFHAVRLHPLDTEAVDEESDDHDDDDNDHDFDGDDGENRTVKDADALKEENGNSAEKQQTVYDTNDQTQL